MTLASFVSLGNVVGETSNPVVAESVMSPVRFSALTVKVPVAPVPSISNSFSEVSSFANKGAYAPEAS